MSSVTSLEARTAGAASLEARLRAVEDRLEIQALAAGFSDAVNERDVTTFAQLWASNHSIWEIGSLFRPVPKAKMQSLQC